MAFTFAFAPMSAENADAAAQTDISAVYKNVQEYAYNSVKGQPVIGSIGGDWLLYGLKTAGYSMPSAFIKSYTDSVEAAVKKGYRGVPGVLHDKKYTEYSRTIFVYATLGEDPTDIAGYNIVEKLYDFDKVVWQGINGPIWALRALDQAKFELTELSEEEMAELGISAYDSETKTGGVTTRDRLIEYILSYQTPDGGWNVSATAETLSSTTADPDMTGMAMAALAPYRARKDVKAALEKAVKVLSDIQDADGGYSTMGSATSESCAQVICGLTAYGINPNTDSRFKKNGKSVVDALLSYYDSNVGGFRHVNTASGGYEPVVNQMATEQALYSLAAYKKTVPNKVTGAALVKSNKTTEKKVNGKTVKSTSYGFKLTWSKANIGTGYQVKVATDSGFTKNAGSYTVTGRSATSKIVRGLTHGKTYYVKVRAYKTVNGVKVYGAYSTSKKITL